MSSFSVSAHDCSADHFGLFPLFRSILFISSLKHLDSHSENSDPEWKTGCDFIRLKWKYEQYKQCLGPNQKVFLWKRRDEKTGQSALGHLDIMITNGPEIPYLIDDSSILDLEKRNWNQRRSLRLDASLPALGIWNTLCCNATFWKPHPCSCCSPPKKSMITA